MIISGASVTALTVISPESALNASGTKPLIRRIGIILCAVSAAASILTLVLAAFTA